MLIFSLLNPSLRGYALFLLQTASNYSPLLKDYYQSEESCFFPPSSSSDDSDPFSTLLPATPASSPHHAGTRIIEYSHSIPEENTHIIDNNRKKKKMSLQENIKRNEFKFLFVSALVYGLGIFNRLFMVAVIAKDGSGGRGGWRQTFLVVLLRYVIELINDSSISRHVVEKLVGGQKPSSSSPTTSQFLLGLITASPRCFLELFLLNRSNMLVRDRKIVSDSLPMTCNLGLDILREGSVQTDMSNLVNNILLTFSLDNGQVLKKRLRYEFFHHYLLATIGSRILESIVKQITIYRNELFELEREDRINRWIKRGRKDKGESNERMRWLFGQVWVDFEVSLEIDLQIKSQLEEHERDEERQEFLRRSCGRRRRMNLLHLEGEG